MKKINILTVIFLLNTLSCFAKVTEWVDPTYNFNNVKRIYVMLQIVEPECGDEEDLIKLTQF